MSPPSPPVAGLRLQPLLDTTPTLSDVHRHRPSSSFMTRLSVRWAAP
ncbi:hypothetical protein HanIR_Chr09g0393551 [Helianthus annuus]|nr:hypothetical protein HanIR_Chr09g0393551 [Helianthus annuus]